MNGNAPRLDGKTVLVRIDLEADINAVVGREIASLAERGARVALVAGYGDPRGDVNPALSLRSFVLPLEQAIGAPVRFVPECIGSGAEAGLARVPFGAVVLMENLRFHPDHHRRSRTFAIRLSVLGDFFAIPGGMPKTDPGWICALTALLPSLGTDCRQSA